MSTLILYRYSLTVVVIFDNIKTLPYRGNAFRVVYAVRLGPDLWVIHALQKKATQGINTPKHEIDLVKDRLRKLREMLV
jgi:phage-related protein